VADDPDLQVSYIATNLQLPAWLERIPYLRTVVRFPLYLAGLIRGFRRVEVVHVFSASFSSFLIATAPAYFVSRMLRKKVLINYRSGLAGKHMRASPFARRVLTNADRVVVPSTYLVDVFHESQITAQAIPNVVDLMRFRIAFAILFGPSCYALAISNTGMELIWCCALLRKCKNHFRKRACASLEKGPGKPLSAASSPT
jgi:hypothetical protein